MRRRVVITGAGVISSLGDSPALLHSALCQGRSALHAVEDREFDHLACRRAGHISAFRPDAYLPQKCFRPLDRTGQLVVSSARLALEDSGWTADALSQHEVGIVLGTMFGSVHTISRFDRHALVQGPAYASPMDFANTVINAAAGQTAIWHKLRGVNSTIACGSASGLLALGYAADLIRYGHQTAILAGGADEFCFESFCGFERAGLLYEGSNGHGCAVPFDHRRTGFALGEAAALLMLEDYETALCRGARILAEIRGYGSAYNPAGDRNGHQSGAIARAIQAASEDASLSLFEIDCISASASGSVNIDRNEALAIKNVWNGFSSLVPVTAIKSMLGETLGASGVLQSIDLIETMRTGQLPSIAGLQDSGPALPSLDFCREQRAVRVRAGLVNSVGFDGHACSLLISQPHDSN